MAELILGKTVAASLNEKTKQKVDELKAKGIEITLAVIIVGDDPASRVYVNNKKKACENLGIKSAEYALDENVTQSELLSLVEKLNNDDSVTGILCQLPIPKHLDDKEIINAISPEKDVDCFHPVNVGKLVIGEGKLLPCTPAGIVEMLDYYNIPIEGKNCVVIGRSNIVGKPMSSLLLNRNGTVTTCHSKTENLAAVTSEADILVCAVGKPKFVTADMVKEGAVVIDVGIHRMENGKLCGDVLFDEVEPKCSFITPVPGGVGPMTIAGLMKNTVTAAMIQNSVL